MPTEEYGIYSVFLSWFNLICVFSSLSVYNGTFNKAMIKYKEHRDEYISSVQWLTLFTSIGFAAFFLAFHKTIINRTGYSLKFLLLMCIHLLLFPSFQYWSQKQRYLFEYKKLVSVTLINATASLFFGVIVVCISDDKSFALIASTVCVQAVVNTVLFISMAYHGKTFYNKEYWTWSIIMAVPLIPHYLSEILLGHADRLMINQMCGASQAGIYNIVYQISMIMTIIRTGINGSFTPWLYYSMKGKRYKEIRRTTKMITLLMAVLTLFFMLIGPEMLRFVAPPSYSEAMTGIPAIMIGGFFIFVYVLFLNIEIYYEQNRFVAIASIVAALMNVILNAIFIRKIGYIAAAYTTMSSYALMAVMHCLAFIKIVKKHAEIKSVFDLRFLLTSSIVLLIMGSVILNLYHVTVVRWIVIFILCAVFTVKRTDIKNILLMLRTKD